jgi:hypothetical protein
MKPGLSIFDRVVTNLMRVEITLRNVLYISYAVPERNLRGLVPDFIRLAVLEKDIAFLSIVILQNTKVRIKSFPFTRFNYNQLNLRTYVIDPLTGKHGVYFLKSGVTSRFISLTTRMIGIPWQHIDLEVQFTPDGENSGCFYSAAGKWERNFYVSAMKLPESTNKLMLFTDLESAVDYIVRPLIGFFGESVHIGRFTIWHQNIMPQIWQLQEVDFPSMNELVTIEGVDNPHSVFFLQQADFCINMPPTFISKKGGE